MTEARHSPHVSLHGDGMHSELFLLSANPELYRQAQDELGEDRQIVHCPTLKALRTKMARSTAGAVLVHLDKATLNGHSPGRFVAELGDTVIHAPMVGLVDESCPVRLRDLAGKLVDRCLSLPLDHEQLSTALSEAPDLESQLDEFRRHMPHRELVGESCSLVTFTPEMFGMLDEIKVAGRHDVTALLVGETGCGKTHLARLIHELSPRRDEQFCTVACGALPSDLIESELFGHIKGSFTGADATRQGKFAAAGRGTLLLDEIDVLPVEQQAKLLRVIETGQYEPVGSNETQHSEARLIVASNYNIEDLVAAGTFRSDLYYRLNIISFQVPPLRQRPWDVEFLVRQFALMHSREHNIPLRGIEPEFIAALKTYNWPGNIREMENVIRRAVLYCQRGVLAVGDLPRSIREATPGQASPVRQPARLEAGAPVVNLPDGPRQTSEPPVHRGAGFDGELTQHMPAEALLHPGGGGVAQAVTSGAQAVASAGQDVATRSAASPVGSSYPPTTLEERVDLLERQIIEDSLNRNNHRRKQTSAELGISRVTLYNKMKKFGMLG